MVKVNLRPKLEEIIDIYKECRAFYESKLAEIDAINKKFAEDVKMLNPDVGTRSRLENERSLKIKSINAEIDKMRASFKSEISAREKSIDNLFGEPFKMAAEKVDFAVVNAMKNGLYTSTELLELFNKYNNENNIAMLRAVSKHAEQVSAEEKNTDMARALKSLTFKVKNIVPAYKPLVTNTIDVCNRSLGIRDNIANPASIGLKNSENYHNLAKSWGERYFKKFADEYLTKAEGITVTAGVPTIND